MGDDKDDELEGIGIEYEDMDDNDDDNDDALEAQTPVQEEEYQFLDEDEEEVSLTDTEDAPQAQGFFAQAKKIFAETLGEENAEKLKGMAIPLGIGFIFVVYAFFKLIGLFVGGDTTQQTTIQGVPTQFTQTTTVTETQKLSEQTPSASQSTHPTVPSVPTSVKPVSPPPTSTPTSTSSRTAVPSVATPAAPSTPHMATLTAPGSIAMSPAQQSLIETLLKRLESIESQNKAMQQALDKANQSSAALTEKLSALERNVSNLSGTLRIVNKNVSDIETVVKKRPISSMAGPSAFQRRQTAPSGIRGGIARFQTPLYRVDAVIPGRAWLKNQNGNTVTVSKGDQIRGYGYVTLIDAEEGLVVTSSGIVFRYGIDTQH